MILAIEPIFANAQHAPTNAGLLRSILIAFAEETVVFAAHPKQQEAVRAVLGDVDPKHLTMVDIEVLPAGGISVKRFLSQFRAIFGVTRRLNARVTLCLGTTPETLFACRLLAMIRPAARIVGVLHGNLDKANGWRSRDPRRRWFDERASLTVADHPAITLVVLERSIAQAAISLGLVPRERCIVWPHPINEREVWSEPHKPDPRRIRIGFVGAGKRGKGFGEFLALSRQLAATSDRYDFRLIGAIYDSFPPDELVHIKAQAGFLERDEFLRQLHEIDYVCLPLKNDTYTLTASAALIDAVAALKPIIALPTPATRDLFEGGPIGYLCDDLAAMATVLADADKLADPVAYATFQTNLERQRAGRLPAALAGAIGSALR